MPRIEGSRGFEGLWRFALESLISDGELIPPITNPNSPHSAFGAGGSKLLECRGWSAIDYQPRARLLRSRERRAWPDQAFGMALWHLSGSPSLRDIVVVNPNGTRFSDDGKMLRGAWGQRIFGGSPDDLLERAIAVLDNDVSSFRAVIPIYRAADLGVESRDIPCLTTLQFVVRGDGLHLIASLRALNPYWIWSYDHFFLSVLSELVAVRLNIQLASITYFTASLHVSIDDRSRIAEALSNNIMDAVPMPAMDTRAADPHELLLLRKRYLQWTVEANKDSKAQMSSEGLDSWWSGYVAAFNDARKARSEGRDPAASAWLTI